MPPKRAERAPSEDSSALSSAPSDTEEANPIIPEIETVTELLQEVKRKRKVVELDATAGDQSTSNPSKKVKLPAKTKPPAMTNPVAKTKPSAKTKPPAKIQSTAKQSQQAKKSALSEPAEDSDSDSDSSPEYILKVEPTQSRKTIRSRNDKPEQDSPPPTKTKRPVKKVRIQVEGELSIEEAEAANETASKKVPKKRKTKEEKEAEAMPLAPRTLSPKMIIGAHVSAAGGVHNATVNAVHIGANAFALFLKSQRKWTNPPLEPAQCKAFHDHCEKHVYDQNKHVVPHGSYLVNLAHTDPDRTKQAYDTFLDDLHRCERLGIALYNFHPGNCLTTPRPAAIAHLANSLNRAHKETSTVVTLLENMAAGGNVLGSTFEDLRDIIALVENKSRIGVCLDTCHAFAAGFDLRTKSALDATLQKFDEVVGIKYLRALHLNDSKAPFESFRDLHANIGTGFLGLRAFHAVVNEGRFRGLPMVLETPITVRDEGGEVVRDEKRNEVEDKGIWAREIKMLEGLVGVDVETDEFRELESRLQRQGAPERERIRAQFDKAVEKKAKAAVKKAGGRKADAGSKAKGKGKGKKREAEEETGSELSDVSASD